MIGRPLPKLPGNSLLMIRKDIVTPANTALAIGSAAASPLLIPLSFLNAGYQIAAGLITRDRERINWGLLAVPVSFQAVGQKVEDAGQSVKHTNFYPSAAFYSRMAIFYKGRVTCYYDRLLGRDPGRYQNHHTPELFKAEMQSYLSFVLYCFEQATPTTSADSPTTPEKLRRASVLSQKQMAFDRRAVINEFVHDAFAGRPETDVLVDIERQFITGLFNTQNLSPSDRQLLERNVPPNWDEKSSH